MGSLKAAPILLLLFLATVSAQTTPTFNITTLLDGFPDFSILNQLLTSTKVADEINARQSLTILAVTNGVLSAFQGSNPNTDLSDVLRYHVLLQFFGLDELKNLDMVNATSVTTLLQTTGRLPGNEGELNIYNLPAAVLFGSTVAGSTSGNATLVTNITRVDYEISIIQIDRVLIPPSFGIVQPTTPPPAPPTPVAPASEPATPASEPALASEPTTPASEPAPPSMAPTKPPTKPTPPTKAPASDAAPGSESAPGSGAVVVKGGVVAFFASLLAVLFM
ncbi:hypothetical protein R1flu_028416 [Riccia fluitans]|uniref:FAS1 domain-containing protein n=1 Tax=Riccia fluitans TaxID=41844 RepID=A0ABD1XM88_9MARC